MCDVTDYLNTYGMTAKELVSKIIRDIYDTMGMTATAGIGTNLYLCKVAMDILAKHVEPDYNGVRIAELNENQLQTFALDASAITDFGGSDRDTQKNFCLMAFITWEMWRDVPLEKKQIIIMKNCCIVCLG